MADADAREWERRWRADSGDTEALERAIALRRRAAETVPWSMLEARRQPPRAFECRARLNVSAVLPVGKVHRVGRTPGRVQIPRHRRWWVEPVEAPTKKNVGGLIEALAESGVPGLQLPPTSLTNRALLEPLEAVQSLTLLDLSTCEGLSAPGLRFLAQLGRLEALILGRTELLSYLDALSPCPLTFLGLRDAPITERGLANVLAFPGLTALELQGESLRSEVLESLAAMPALEWIRLSRGALAETLPHLPAGLRHLSLAWTDVQAADLAPLVRLEALETLDLAGCPRLTALGFEHLAGLPRLRALDLRSCGGVRDLRELETGFAALERIDLRATGAPARDLERLAKRRPELVLTA